MYRERERETAAADGYCVQGKGSDIVFTVYNAYIKRPAQPISVKVCACRTKPQKFCSAPFVLLLQSNTSRQQQCERDAHVTRVELLGFLHLYILPLIIYYILYAVLYSTM